MDGRRAGDGLARAGLATGTAMGTEESYRGDGRGRGPGGRGGRAIGRAGRGDSGQGRPDRIALRETSAKTALADSNAELTRSQAAVQARYKLAVEAIEAFHTGVSEDFLLKEEKFKDLRDRLLKSASEFYGKLGALLGKESDLASRRALWQANFEVAELTREVGKPEDALAAHRQVSPPALRWWPKPRPIRRSRPNWAAA